MTKKLEILIVEDNDNHLADALNEAKKQENTNVDVARDLSGYYSLISKKQYDAIITDIFFPSDAKKPWDNLASNLVWDILGRKFCEQHSDFYRSGDEKLEKMYEMVRDDWMDGKEIPPSGVIVADRAKKAGIPVVFCTDTYHHGIKTQPVSYYAIENHICMIDGYEEGNRDGNVSHKNWKKAFDTVYWKLSK